jgi:hypothetical protein
MTVEATNFEILKIKNEKELLNLLPVELWRIVDEFSDAKTHVRLRASCTSMRDWIPFENNVEFNEYEILWEKICQKGSNNEPTKGRKEAFQAAIHLNPYAITQENYTYLCRNYLNLEVLRICRLALLPPFTCSHIDISGCKNYAFRLAARNGHSFIVALLLADPRVDPTAMNDEAFRFASNNRHSSVIELLLADPRVDPTAMNNEAIRYASEKGHSSVVALLLADPRVDPAADDNYAIRMASKKGHSSVVQLLLAHPRVDPTARNNEAIRFASNNGHSSVVALLLSS